MPGCHVSGSIKALTNQKLFHDHSNHTKNYKQFKDYSKKFDAQTVHSEANKVADRKNKWEHAAFLLNKFISKLDP